MLAPQMKQAEALYRQNGETSRVFAELKYETLDTWSRARRVVGKAEHMEGGPNPRFVVTSMTRIRFDAQSMYEDEYCARGNMENCIKEHQMGVFSDRASSSSFRANNLRLWFSAVGCALMDDFRRLGRGRSLITRTRPAIRRRLSSPNSPRPYSTGQYRRVAGNRAGGAN